MPFKITMFINFVQLFPFWHNTGVQEYSSGSFPNFLPKASNNTVCVKKQVYINLVILFPLVYSILDFWNTPPTSV